MYRILQKMKNGASHFMWLEKAKGQMDYSEYSNEGLGSTKDKKISWLAGDFWLLYIRLHLFVGWLVQ